MRPGRRPDLRPDLRRHSGAKLVTVGEVADKPEINSAFRPKAAQKALADADRFLGDQHMGRRDATGVIGWQAPFDLARRMKRLKRLGHVAIE